MTGISMEHDERLTFQDYFAKIWADLERPAGMA